MIKPTLPILDETLCTGSAACVMVCPTACLEMLGSRPWLARPADCIACGACAAVCPTGAIRFEPATQPQDPNCSAEPSA